VSVRYVLKLDPDAELSKPLRLPSVIRRYRKAIRSRGVSFKLRRQGGLENWADRPLDKHVDLLKRLLSKQLVGNAYIGTGDADPDPVVVRVIEIEPDIVPVDTPGVPAIDRIVGALNTLWKGKWSNLGICVCKRIVGSSSYSDHAYCAAIDIHATPPIMQDIADYFVDKATTYDVKYLIYNRRIWQPGSGWGPYSGSDPHTSHVHCSVNHGTVKLAC